MAYPLYVDISSFQPSSVDWAAYTAWAKQWDGIARVACRASEGTGVGDANYQTYIPAIRKADQNAIILHYHYAYPQYNAAVDEVNWMAQEVNGVGLGAQDIIMLDFEENVVSGTDAAWALAWLQAAEAKFGRVPVIYASLSMVQNRLQDVRLTRYPLILADWTANQPPPPAPWNTLWAWQYTDALSGVPGFGGAAVDANMFLASQWPGGSSVPIITNNGAVVDMQKSYQLMYTNESQDQCGPWTAAELKYAGLPGHGPTGDVAAVHNFAYQEYTNYLGPDVTSNQTGSSIDNMHSFFHDAGYHYWDISAININSVRSHDNAEIIAALNAGYPVVVTVNEQSVIRRNGTNPYPWQPQLGPVNHIFCIVGYTNDGYFMVDDELDPNDPWPIHYSQSHLEIHWASTIGLVGPDPAHPWFAPIPSDDPLSWPAGFNGQLFTGGTTMAGVPNGWHDDGSRLTAPNGHYFVFGFRDIVLKNNWDPADQPNEEEYHADPVQLHRPDFGAGQRQTTRDHDLWYSPSSGLGPIKEAYIGLELSAVYAANASLQTQLATAASNLSAVQAQLAACQASGGGVPANLQAAINQAVTELQAVTQSLTAVQSNAAALESQLQPFVK